MSSSDLAVNSAFCFSELHTDESRGGVSDVFINMFNHLSLITHNNHV